MDDVQREKKSSIAEREEKLLAFWEANNIFEASLAKPAPRGEFVFYDGPPFATGLPHYGHIVAGTIKDVIPRYKTMRGYHVPRRWGWDCHGLPIENLVEKELGVETKKEIEEYGVAAFNEKARGSVLRYADEWKRIVPRTGRWVDMERDYRSMDPTYTESIWWAFKELYDNKLVYKGFKSMHLCPRCETTLSNFEVAQGYHEVTDLAVTVALPLVSREATALLVWTTTPWTLPGNVAAAVNPDIVYATVAVDGKQYIVAKDRVEDVFADHEHEIVSEERGSELVGLRYEPPFEYFKDQDIEHKAAAWQIYAGDFVTTDEGAGIVHIAPAFGADDLLLAQKHTLPLIHHVTKSGVFTDAVTDFSGMPVKPKGDHQAADIEIIKYLAHNGLLFKKEKITHSYPLCWRCDTPLLNYATDSWFVEVTKLKDKLVAQNRDVHWVPKEVGEKRFGNWLEGARDWAISRSRYWGAPIPVWETNDGERVVIDSFAELKKYARTSGNRYMVMRHGKSKSNEQNRISGTADGELDELTEEGKEQVRDACRRFKAGDIDIIYTSPFERTKETAAYVAEALGIDGEQVIVDERLGEIKTGVLDGRPIGEYHALFTSIKERFVKAPEGGETACDVKRRVGSFLYDIETKHQNKKILIVSHEYPIWLLHAVARGANVEVSANMKKETSHDTAEMRGLEFLPLSHNADYELDVHRPYIDEVELATKNGKALHRVPEVFDVWFESGSMPYASAHYPFSTDTFQPKGGLFKTRKRFPADFIAEGIDQTRGWFYSLLVLGAGLFGRTPYKNVIVNGTILAEDGQKMSKRLQNYPDPMDVIDRYGADALRFYLLSSPAVRAEDLNFSEAGVDEVLKRIIMRFDNVARFYETYVTDEQLITSDQHGESTNVLDQWILSRLWQCAREVTDGLDAYALDRAARPLASFIDDLSTWYIRRSRDRFKADDPDGHHAKETTRFVLLTLAKLVAPFMPFISEDIYQRLSGPKKSVHLDDWPDVGSVNKKVLVDMERARRIVSEALEARAQAGIKVRQPLARLTVRTDTPLSDHGYHVLIEDEVNVKEVVFIDETGWTIDLDTDMTPELLREGRFRDFVRALQDARKKAKLAPTDSVPLSVVTDASGKEFIDSFAPELKEAVRLTEITFADSVEGPSVSVDDMFFTVSFT